MHKTYWISTNCILDKIITQNILTNPTTIDLQSKRFFVPLPVSTSECIFYQIRTSDKVAFWFACAQKKGTNLATFVISLASHIQILRIIWGGIYFICMVWMINDIIASIYWA